jgi:hypothetical protein
VPGGGEGSVRGDRPRQTANGSGSSVVTDPAGILPSPNSGTVIDNHGFTLQKGPKSPRRDLRRG